VSDETEVEVRVYSPRWGHEDTYTISMARDWMKVERHPKSATCKWVESKDPVWESSDDSLLEVFANDSIYAPAIFPHALVGAWLDWRSGEIDDARVDAEIQELFGWLNAVTHAKPTSDYWKGKF
jgi:hypothetical protein